MTARSQARNVPPQPSKRFGSTEPRVWTPPLRELTEDTTLGFECIQFTRDILEMDLMPWQEWFLLHALELHPSEVGEDGGPLFRFRKVVMLVGRQSGKSTVMQALTLWRMFVDRCNLVVGTAQDLEVAESLWAEAVEMAQDVDELAAEIAKVEKGAGKKNMRLRTGETYKVKAASRRGGRGLSGELVLLDELREHSTWDAWAAVTKTTNAKERAQIFGISNAGDSTSIVLRHLRQMAHDRLGDPDGLNRDEAEPVDVPDDLEDLERDDADDSLGIFEWSAPPGCDKWDRDAWAMANPALGYRVRESTLASDAATDPDWVFRTEVLCQWTQGTLVGPFPPGTWEAGVDPDSAVAADSPRAWCVDVSHDRSMAYIAVAGLRPDGEPHVEVVAQRAGTAWVSDWFAERESRRSWPVAVQSRGAPVSSLLDELHDVDGLTVMDWQGSALGAATGAFYDSVRCEMTADHRPARVWHRPQPVLDVSASTAVIKPLGESYVWSRAKSPTDAAPLVAVTGALWALRQKTDAPEVSVYESRGLVTL